MSDNQPLDDLESLLGPIDAPQIGVHGMPIVGSSAAALAPSPTPAQLDPEYLKTLPPPPPPPEELALLPPPPPAPDESAPAIAVGPIGDPAAAQAARIDGLVDQAIAGGGSVQVDDDELSALIDELKADLSDEAAANEADTSVSAGLAPPAELTVTSADDLLDAALAEEALAADVTAPPQLGAGPVGAPPALEAAPEDPVSDTTLPIDPVADAEAAEVMAGYDSMGAPVSAEPMDDGLHLTAGPSAGIEPQPEMHEPPASVTHSHDVTAAESAPTTLPALVPFDLDAIRAQLNASSDAERSASPGIRWTGARLALGAGSESTRRRRAAANGTSFGPSADGPIAVGPIGQPAFDVDEIVERNAPAGANSQASDDLDRARAALADPADEVAALEAAVIAGSPRLARDDSSPDTSLPEPATSIADDDPHRADILGAIEDADALRNRATETLRQSQRQSQRLLDDATARAAEIVAEAEGKGADVVDAARERAVAIVGAAQTRADELIGEISGEVKRIEDSARSAAHQVAEKVRIDAQRRAADVTEEAMNEAERRVREGDDEARRIIEEANGRAADIVTGAHSEAAADEARGAATLNDAVEKAQALVEGAQERSDALLDAARTEADELRDQTRVQATELLEAAARESENVLANAHDDADAIRAEANEMLNAIEAIRDGAERDVAAAAEEAARHAAAESQAETADRLADARAEADRLEQAARAVLDEAERDAAAMRDQATADANAVLSTANDRASEITERAMEDATGIRSAAQERVDGLLESGRLRSTELMESARARVEEMLVSAQAEVEQIRADAREAAQQVIRDAARSSETVEPDSGFSGLWDGDTGADLGADAFFADMQDRDAVDVFKP